MSFSGDLEYLSIVDVIQLLHGTRKSGTLAVRGQKGEISLAFSDGYIVGATHFDSNARTGSILVEAGVISPEGLERALALQASAGTMRRPLIATMLENNLVDKKDAYRGLEALIELAIVEIMTWKRGNFSLDADNVKVSDEYRYFPEKLKDEMTLSTEHVLMDALRIYDEKKRDGLIRDEEIPDDEPLILDLVEDGELTISADDLGLGDLGAVKRKIPGVYEGIRDDSRITGHRNALRDSGSRMGEAELLELAAFLDRFGSAGGLQAESHSADPVTAIFYSGDRLMTYCVNTVCRHLGVNVLVSNDGEDLGVFGEQFLHKGQVPLLLLDSPSIPSTGFSPERLIAVSKSYQKKYPKVPIIQLANPTDYRFWLSCLESGATLFFPRPALSEAGGRLVTDSKIFLELLPGFIKTCHGRFSG